MYSIKLANYVVWSQSDTENMWALNKVADIIMASSNCNEHIDNSFLIPCSFLRNAPLSLDPVCSALLTLSSRSNKLLSFLFLVPCVR
jgi:hypothetical protein